MLKEISSWDWLVYLFCEFFNFKLYVLYIVVEISIGEMFLGFIFSVCVVFDERLCCLGEIVGGW